MKTTKATKNINKYMNSISGKPKRVRTITDDFGNQVHVVKKKGGGTRIKNSGATGSRHTLSQKKRVAKKLYDTSLFYDTKEDKHNKSAERRRLLLKSLVKKSNVGIDKNPTHVKDLKATLKMRDKKEYHRNLVLPKKYRS